jgi:predicted metalloprotease with PDZ domain
MRHYRWIVVVAVALLATALLIAGDYKCTKSTQECLDMMAAKMKDSGWVGVELETDEATGAYAILRVVPDSPAKAAGLRPGDVLLAMNGIRISEKNHEALWKAKKDMKPGDSVKYTVKRDGTDREVSITLAPMPADVLARFIGQHMLTHASAGVIGK